MTTPISVIRGGLEGRERLRVLARVMAPTTSELFDRLDIPRDARCLDVGCGGGDVTLALARRVPDGEVVGVDLDETKLDIARAEASATGVGNVEFVPADVTEVRPDLGGFDTVYIRFVLTHLTDPAAALVNLVERATPGGVIAVEDIDCRGHFCEPRSAAFDRYVELYQQVARHRGCDPDIGPRLPGLLHGAGLERTAFRVVQPAGFEGEAKLIAPITLEAIAGSILEAGLATVPELEALVDELYRLADTEGLVMSLPRIVQAWGHLAT